MHKLTLPLFSGLHVSADPQAVITFIASKLPLLGGTRYTRVEYIYL